MSISNPDITSGALEPCGSASMATDQIIESEPLKSSITTSKMPLVNNMDIYSQSVNKLMQNQALGSDLESGKTKLTATSFNIMRFHLKRRQPLERIIAGSDTVTSLETKPRQSDARSNKMRQTLPNPEVGRLSETSPKNVDSISPTVRKAITSPRQAIAQPRRSPSNMEVNSSTGVANSTLNHDTNLPLRQVQAENFVELIDDNYDEELPNCSGYNSSCGGSGAENQDWLDSHSFNMDSNGKSNFNSWHNQNLQLVKKPRNSMTYDQWLALKRKQACQLHRQRRREAHLLAAAEQMRKQMSEKSYSEWLASKQKVRHHHSLYRDQNHEVSHGSKIRSGLHQNLPYMQVMSDARSWRDRNMKTFRKNTMPLSTYKVQQWEMNKVIEEDHRRLLKRREQADREAETEERRRLSKIAWNRWLDQITGRSLVDRNQNSMGKRGKQRICEQIGIQQRAGSIAGRRKNDFRNSVPPSIAQRALRQRLDSIDGVQMYRNQS